MQSGKSHGLKGVKRRVAYADELGYDKLAEKAVNLSRDFINGKQ